MLLPHPAVVNRGPDVFAHTGIRLLLSGQTGLQLADLISGDKLRAVLANLTGMLDVLCNLLDRYLIGNILPEHLPQLLDKLLWDGRNHPEVFLKPLFQQLLIKSLIIIAGQDLYSQRPLDRLLPSAVDHIANKQRCGFDLLGGVVLFLLFLRSSIILER